MYIFLLTNTSKKKKEKKRKKRKEKKRKEKMSYYLFPKGNVDLSKGFSVEISNIPAPHESADKTKHILQKTRLSPSLTNYLFELQENTNSIEFKQLQKEIFNCSKGMLHRYSETHSPFFFEIIEIIQTMHLNHYIDTISKNTPLSIFSFCNRRDHARECDESNRRDHARECDEYKKKTDIDAMKIIREPYKRYFIPDLETSKDHYFLAEPDMIYSLETFKETYFKYGSKMHIIFASSLDLPLSSSQTPSIPEIIIQLSMIFCIPAKKGVFLWKIEETYSDIMLDILYLLSSFYEKMYFIKPTIIDSSKSEKYVVCKGFLFETGYNLYSYLYPLVSQMSLLRLSPHIHIDRILKINIAYFFVSKLEEINYIFGQVQLEQLHYLSLLVSHKYRYDKVQNISKINIQKMQEWWSKHHFFLQYLQL